VGPEEDGQRPAPKRSRKVQGVQARGARSAMKAPRVLSMSRKGKRVRKETTLINTLTNTLNTLINTHTHTQTHL
jgi:hypothetical protein